MTFPNPRPAAKAASDCPMPSSHFLERNTEERATPAAAAKRGPILTQAWEKATALILDSAMCAFMFAIQRRHRLDAGSREIFERYVREFETLGRAEFFAAPPPAGFEGDPTSRRLHWLSPIPSAFPKNDRIHVDLYPCARGWSAPTVLMLHALMSASDTGYRSWAARFNARAWNACFVHLPYHYSRTPPGHFNGELAVTADLVRTAKGLRQGVIELRQLMATLRAWGCREFGVWAASYGAWIGALLASVETDLRFVALLEPIVDVEHAVWVSPAGAALRRELRPRGIDETLVERHLPLISPLHGAPLCDPAAVLLVAGAYDRVAPAEPIARLHAKWRGSAFLEIAQGHFGYRMMPAVWEWLGERGLVA
jgi:pimeloyl-ACP methyl ester carboxylesterase